MIRVRPGEVVRATERHAGLVDLEVEVEGRIERALAYPALTGPVVEGDRVALNTTAVAGGSGGSAVARADGEGSGSCRFHLTLQTHFALRNYARNVAK